MRRPSRCGLAGDDLADVEPGQRERLALAFERDVRGIVRADEEVGAGGRELADVVSEHAAQRRPVVPVPRVQHVVHGDAGQRDLGMQMRAEARDAFEAHRAVAQCRAFEAVRQDADMLHSTVTLLARLRGWSTSVPLSTAV